MEDKPPTEPLPAMKKNIPIMLLAEGKEQVIKVNHKMTLAKIMALLAARSPPVFTDFRCGKEGVKTSITLDLSCGDTDNIVVVEGEPLVTKDAAENSAIMMAFKHLEQDCHVNVLDFSSRVARSFGAYNTYSCVNEAMGLVQKMLDNFDMALGKCKDLAVKETLGGKLDGNVLVYDELRKYLWTVLKSFSINASAARYKMKDLEIDRMKHHKRGMEKPKTISSKRYLRTVVFPARELLDYVLSHFGLEKANYSNGPHGNGRVKATVQFIVPYMKHLKFCGTLIVKGKGDTSTKAEEAAAFEALLLIERNFKVKIIDLNHSDWVEAETIQKMLLTMLGEIIVVGQSVKDMWEKLFNALEKQREHCTYEAELAKETLVAEKQFDACKLCADGIDTLVQDSVKCYDACWGLFGRLKKIKARLDMI